MKMFINLPVKDLNNSINFFTQLGFTFAPEFTDHKATCIEIAENMNVMLLVDERFKEVSHKEICDTEQQTEVLIALQAESRDEVDELVEKAVKAGGKTYTAAQDHGWMYGHGFEDLDGHQWEIFYMDHHLKRQSMKE